MIAMPQLSYVAARVGNPASRAWAVGDLAFERMAAGEEIIHLGVGDPDLDTPEPIRRALASAVERGRTHYSPIAGEPGTRAAIAAHARALYGGKVTSNQVTVCNGAQGALFATFQCLAGPGDEVIVLEPFYATYPAAVTAGGAAMVPVALDAQPGYQLEPARIEAAITPRTRAILINSPGNPSGTVFSQSATDDLARLCAARGIWLVSDEVYWSLTYDAPHSSPFRVTEARETTIVVNSLSKSHAMTGWRIGWAIGPEAFIAAMVNLGQALHFGINQFVQEAAIAALADDATPSRIRQIFRARRDALIAGLSESKTLRFSVPEGGMFVLADVSKTGLDGKAFAERLLDAERVALVPGFGFGESVKNTVRIGFLCDEPRLTEAARRITRFADRLEA